MLQVIANAGEEVTQDHEAARRHLVEVGLLDAANDALAKLRFVYMAMCCQDETLWGDWMLEGAASVIRECIDDFERLEQAAEKAM